MLDAKMVADLITGTRGLLGLVIIWLGFAQGDRALPMVVFLMLLDWTGDFVDGGIAHRSGRPRRTLIGDSDIYIDLFVSLCLGIYLIAAEFVGLAVGFWYVVGWTTLIWRFGLDRNLVMLAQTPIYLYFILIALQTFPAGGTWLVIWVLTALAINWRRFSRQIVPNFLKGMHSLWNDRGNRVIRR